MPLTRCTNKGESGWKWGDAGECYVGPDGKKKAIEQGLAMGELTKEHAILLAAEMEATVVTARLSAGPLPSGYLRAFRLLSADITLHANDGRTFSIPAAVLEAAVGLFDGVPVKTDHSRGVLATVGRTSAPRFVAATEQKPAGIEADISITLNTEDGCAAAALLEQDLIRCASANITFDADETNGQLFATRIGKVREVSLVDEGDDPYAARLAAARGGKAMAANDAALAAKVMDEKGFVAALLAGMKLGADTTMEDLLGKVFDLLQGKKIEEPVKPAEPPKPTDAVPPVDGAAAQLAADTTRLLAALGAANADEGVAAVIRYQTEFIPRAAAPSQCAAALAEKRISPAEATGLKSWEAADPEGLRAYLAKRPVNSAVPGGASQSAALMAETQGPAAPVLSPEDEQAIENHGISRDAYLAARKAIAKKHGA